MILLNVLNFILLLINGDNVSQGTKYYANVSICTFNYTIEKKWEIEINLDSTYTYRSEIYKSGAIISSDLFQGKWIVDGDTLILFNENDFGGNIEYVINQNKLVSCKNRVDYFSYAKSYLKELSTFKYDKFMLIE